MKAIIFFADGFELCEGLITVDILRRAGINTVTASVMGRLDIETSGGVTVRADALAEDVDYDSADMVILPGGGLGTENLGKSAIVAEKCRAFAKDKKVAAICAAPTVLAGLGLLEGRKATCYPGCEVNMAGAEMTGEGLATDGNIITGRALGSAFDFALEIVKALAGEETAARVKAGICL